MKRSWSALALAVITAVVIGCGSSPVSNEPGSPDSTAGLGTDSEQIASPIPSLEDPAENPLTPSEALAPITGTAVVPASSGAGTNDFSLLSSNGGVINFADIRGTVPLGLFFFGGSDCPGCEDRLRELQDSYSRFKQLGAELIAISTDLPENTRMTVEELGIDFPVLSDVDGTVSRDWGVFNLLGNGHAAPSIFMFSPSGDEIARQMGVSAAELPGIDEMLQSIQRSLESGTAEPTPTAQPQRPVSSQATPVAPPATSTQTPQSITVPQVATAPEQTSEPVEPAFVSLGAGVTDFRLPDAIGGGEVALSEAIQDRNVVLVFYRAFW